MRLPDFLVLGAPKCGTTTLHHWLGQNPDVGMSEPKETHYFDANHERGPAWYARAFGPVADRVVVGEATPAYLHVAYVPPRARALLPEARLVAVLRDPADRAYSHWWMHRAQGRERRTFAEAVDALLADDPLRRLGGDELERTWRDQVNGRGDPAPAYLWAGYYAKHIERWTAHYPRERLLVLLTEDLAGDPPGAASAVWRHVGADTGVSLPDPARKNEALGAFGSAVDRFLRRTRMMRLGRVLPRRTRRALRSRLLGVGRRPPPDPATLHRLREHYASHNRDLERLLGRDLSAWMP